MLNLRRDIYWPFSHGSWGLSPGEIQVWYADLETFHESFQAGIFSAEELGRASGFRFEQDTRLFLARRGLLRSLLAAYLDIDPNYIAFDIAQNGKPYLANPGTNGLTFSISHSAASALIAFGRDGEIGVDLEKERDDLDPLELANHFFAPAERSALKLMAPQDRKNAFFRIWTRKEAWLKAVGCGLSMPLTDFIVPLDPGDSTLLNCPPQYGRPENWHLVDLQSTPGFAATLACPADCKALFFGTIFAN
ncbi:MAG TPA: 4'-phosphopantetheinyl transferase superfamily protein [Longilinea sp.]|nr:4'-phosphopantetheinyl transferase superfamily protein [Longilinea sp.]